MRLEGLSYGSTPSGGRNPVQLLFDFSGSGVRPDVGVQGGEDPPSLPAHVNLRDLGECGCLVRDPH
eukprot:15412477-Alexandrium_andersonii.AAC.1